MFAFAPILLCVPVLQSAPGEKTAAPPPLVVAHRGASGALPEHTLPAVAYAHALGADYIEQDVVLTRDGVPVVLHDIYLDATTDAAAVFPGRAAAGAAPGERYPVFDLTLAEIKTLRASERFDPATGRPVFPRRFPVRTGDFEVPTLAEELELIAGLNRSTGRRAGVFPELKRPAEHAAAGLDLAPAALRVLADFGYADRDDRCYVQCFDFDELKRVRGELGCDLKLVRLTVPGERLTTADLEETTATCDGLGPPLTDALRFVSYDFQSTGLIERATAAGLAVFPWTARFDALPPASADRRGFADLHAAAFGAGAAGIFTDFPGRTAAALRRAGTSR